MQIDMRVRSHRLKRAADAAEAKARKAAMRAVNDALFETRRLTPTLMAYAIDKPSAYTTSPNGIIVEKATDTALSGRLSLSADRARYLGYSEHGETDTDLVVPSAYGHKNRDKHGNLLKRFRKPYLTTTLQAETTVKRYAARKTKKGEWRRGKVTGTHKVKRYFIGTPRYHGYRKAGIWERGPNNGDVRLVAFFSKRFDYAPKFKIRESWNGELKARFKQNFKKRMTGRRS